MEDVRGTPDCALPWLTMSLDLLRGPASAPDLPSIDLSRQSSSEKSYFTAAKQQLSMAETHSTCKRLATVKLLTSCENLESSPTEDVDLETLQNFYAVHLALCELEGAYPKLRSKCRISLPAYTEDATPHLKAVATEQFRQCINIIKSNENYWTSYSNNRRDAYVWCKAMRPGFDQGLNPMLHVSLN